MRRDELLDHALSHHLLPVTQDANTYDPQRAVDRVVSIELFEHMRDDWLVSHYLLAPR